MDDLVTWLTAQIDADERVAERAGVWCWHECDEADAALHDVFTRDRVLAEVEAKRRMLEFHDRAHPHDGDPCTTQRLLALPYAAREGYRPEWAPA